MELRQLRYFAAVADARGFRRAGLQIGVRQSALSKSVRDLEEELGVSMFERHAGGVRLTHAGWQFLARVRTILEELDGALWAVAAEGRGSEGRLRIGLLASISTSHVRDLIQLWRDGHPRVVLDFTEADPREHLAALRDRRLDAFVATEASADPDLDSEELWAEQIFAAFPVSHAKADHAGVMLDELADECFIVTKSAPGPQIRNFLIRRLASAETYPRIRRYAVGRETLMAMVGLNFGVSLMSGSGTGVDYPGVKFVPALGEAVRTHVVWSPDNDNPALRRFLSLARVMRNEVRNGAPLQRPDPSP